VRRFTRTHEDPITSDKLPLAELLAKAGDGGFLRSVAEAVMQLLMETDMEGVTSAGRQEHSGERTTYRHGYCDRTLNTRLGRLQLRIPKRRQGSYFPPFLEPRKRSEKRSAAMFSSPAVSRVGRKRTGSFGAAKGGRRVFHRVKPLHRRWPGSVLQDVRPHGTV